MAARSGSGRRDPGAVVGPSLESAKQALAAANARNQSWREHLSVRVAADGAGRHEVDSYQLCWAVATARAAAAVAAWVSAGGGEVANCCLEGLAAEALLASAAGSSPAISPPASPEALPASETSAAVRALDRLGQLVLDNPRCLIADAEEHSLLRSTVRAFADREVAPRAQAIHRQDADVPEEIIAGVARLGLFGSSIPEPFGGWAAEPPDRISPLIATEELSRASLGAAGSLMTRPEILVAALLLGGTQEQQRRWLPLLAAGAVQSAVAVTEPDHGSDVARLECRAAADGSGQWLLSGTKLWCTFAGRAELLAVLCRTTPEAGRRGLSLFVLEKPRFSGHEFEHVQPGGGLMRGRAIPTIGYRGMHSFEIRFEDYAVPSTGLLGGEAGLNRGFYLQMAGFAAGRIQTAARAVGVMQAAVEAAAEYARQRWVFGAALGESQLVRCRLGRMAAMVAGARQLTYAATADADFPLAAAVAKLYACRLAEQVSREALQLHGGIGYAEESPVSRYFVDAKVLAIFEGAEDVLALRVIAPALLGRHR